MASTSPESDDARPLSEREHRILGELDDELTEAAPDLAETFANARVPRTGPGMFTADRVASTAAILVILAVVLPTEWLAVVAVIAVLVGATALGIWLGPRDAEAARDGNAHNR